MSLNMRLKKCRWCFPRGQSPGKLHVSEPRARTFTNVSENPRRRWRYESQIIFKQLWTFDADNLQFFFVKQMHSVVQQMCFTQSRSNHCIIMRFFLKEGIWEEERCPGKEAVLSRWFLWMLPCWSISTVPVTMY